MLITINGKSEEIKKRSNLAQLVFDKELCAEKLVIEYNHRIVPKQQWQNILLQENDKVEIISFVGGG